MAKRKDFSNPSMVFISQESIDKVEKAQPEKPRSGRETEAKSKRAQLLMRPSLLAETKETASELGISFNEFVNRAIQEAVYNEYVRELIEKDIRGGE